jgi:hypothetical protein
MALVKHNNNSISAVTSMASLTTGAMTLIKEQTASSSASISFVDGSSDVVLDSTYPIYLFKIINLSQTSGEIQVRFNFTTDGGSNYNVSKTTTIFRAYHDESDTTTSLSYDTGKDLANGTGDQNLTTFDHLGNASDKSLCSDIYLFNPSSTTFVKHFIATSQYIGNADHSVNTYVAGYCNTTSAVDGIKFVLSSGNIASGTFKLYGIKDS